jgi:hypothetical protein
MVGRSGEFVSMGILQIRLMLDSSGQSIRSMCLAVEMLLWHIFLNLGVMVVRKSQWTSEIKTF